MVRRTPKRKAAGSNPVQGAKKGAKTICFGSFLHWWRQRQPPAKPNLIKIRTPTQPPSGKDPEGGLANTRTRKEGMTKARSILREKRI